MRHDPRIVRRRLRDARRRRRPRAPPPRRIPAPRAASPAPSAYCTSRARSARRLPLPRAPSSASRLRSRRRAGSRSTSTASRASSWRKATPSPVGSSTPTRMHSARPSSVPPSTCSSRRGSMRLPITAAASSTARAGGTEPRGARQHRVAHRRRQARRSPLDSTSVTKNGLPEVWRCSAQASTGASGDQQAHRVDRQPRQLDAHGRLRDGEVAQQQAQRRLAGDLVVAIGEHEQDARRGDAPAEELHQVERRLVGPMDVLDDDQRRRSPTRAASSREENSAARGARSRAAPAGGRRSGGRCRRAVRAASA